MSMIGYWATSIFKHKSTNQELIIQYIESYNNAVGDKHEVTLNYINPELEDNEDSLQDEEEQKEDNSKE